MLFESVVGFSTHVKFLNPGGSVKDRVALKSNK